MEKSKNEDEGNKRFVRGRKNIQRTGGGENKTMKR